MTVPDAETYLRCRLEDTLADDDSRSGRDELGHRVRAALAIGAIDDDTAERIVADARRIAELRSQHPDHYDEPDRAQSPRVVVCPTVVQLEWGTLMITHLVFDEHETSIKVRGELTAGLTLGHDPHRRDHPWQTMTILDGSGTSHHVTYSGGSSDTTFEGEYTVYPGLDPATAAITVGDRRIDLSAHPTPPPVRVDALDDHTPLQRAQRHLRNLSAHRFRHGRHDEAALAHETFAGLGLGEVTDGSDADPGRCAPPPRRRQSHRSGKPRTRWSAIGATTPEVDGVVFTLAALSDDGVVAVFGVNLSRLYNHGDRPQVLLSAVDDLGTRYAGESESSGSSDRTFHSDERLVPHLDPAASTLTIALDTLRHRVLVDVPLQWQEAR